MANSIQASGAGSITSRQSGQQIFINGIEFVAGFTLIAMFFEDSWDRNTKIAFLALVGIITIL